MSKPDTIDTRIARARRAVKRRLHAWYVSRRGWFRIILLALIVCLVGVFTFAPWYYWTNPVPVPGNFNVLSDKVEAGLSGDGNTLAIARDSKAGRSDLFILRRESDSWSIPVALDGVNTRHDETDPVFSEDGQYLLFASDRPAGKGGQDIWIASWDGTTWSGPVNAGWGVNSAFDEFGPAISSDTNRLIFASNKPKRRLASEERAIRYRELRRKFAGEDSDLYVSERIGDLPSDPLSPYAYRNPGHINEDMVEQLGGSLRTELAVTRALKWLAKNQEPDGRWSPQKHDGDRRHDVGGTAITTMCFLGRGISHKTDSEYRETVAKAIDWLLSVIKPDGDLRQGNDQNGMYSQGIGTMALAEAYGLSKDERLRAPAQAAVDFIVRAQQSANGSWRYAPGQHFGDMSVFGWQVMALKSALLAGLSVPESTLKKANRWIYTVAGGPNGGLYGYSNKQYQQPAMVAEGMYARQLLSPEKNPARAAESVAYLFDALKKLPDEDFEAYFIYYMTLAMYLHQGEPWDAWNDKLKSELISTQHSEGDEKGTWPIRGKHGTHMGSLITTALSTLSLEIYYRYVPSYDWSMITSARDVPRRAGGSGIASSVGSQTLTAWAAQDAARFVPDVVPRYGVPQSLEAANSAAFDAQPTITAAGDYLYFASDREGGKGGADLYRSRISGDTFGRARKLSPHVNGKADETDPVIAGGGRLLLLSSNRESASGLRYRLYSSQLRRVTPLHLLSRLLQSLLAFLNNAKWWLLLLLLALWAILFLLKRLANENRRKQYTLLQKCILASLLLHLFGLLLTAFWRISTVVAESLGDSSMEVTIDANALSQERLALEIRESIEDLPSASSAFVAEQIETPAPSPDTPQAESPAGAIESESPSERFLTEPSPAPPAEVASKADLPDIVAALPELEMPPVDIRMEEELRETTDTEEALKAPPEPVEISRYRQQELPRSAAVEAVSKFEVERLLEKTPSPPVERVEASTDARTPDFERLAPAMEVTPPELTIEMEAAPAASEDAKEREMPIPAPANVAQQHATKLPVGEPEAIQSAAVSIAEAPVPEPSPLRPEQHIESQASHDVRKIEQTITNVTLTAVAATVIMETREATIDASQDVPETAMVAAAIQTRPLEQPTIHGGTQSEVAIPDVARAPSLPGSTESAVRDSSAAESTPATDSLALKNISGSATRVQISGRAGSPLAAVEGFAMESPSRRARGSSQQGVTAPSATAVTAAGGVALGQHQPALVTEDHGRVSSWGSDFHSEPAQEFSERGALMRGTVDRRAAGAGPSTESKFPPDSRVLGNISGSAMRVPNSGQASIPIAGAAVLKMESAPQSARGSGERRETVSSSIATDAAGVASGRYRSVLAALAHGRASPWPSDHHGNPSPIIGETSVPLPGVAESESPAAGNEPAPVSALTDPGAPGIPIPPSLTRSGEELTPYSLRRATRSERLLEQLGGSSEAEHAVQLALEWLSQVQEQDGRWSVESFGGEGGHDPALTGLALLCFLGWGADHVAEGPYQLNVSRGLEWLTTTMYPNGDFRVIGAKKAMYSQGIAALAITEAYGLTKDKELREPAQKSVDFIVSAQNGDDGAWRYTPREPGDTSVMGWMLMVLKSAELAGLHVPAESLQRAEQWFPRVAGGIEGGLYGYRTPEPRPAMVAEGMFSRQLLGAPRNSATMKESAMYLQKTPPLSDSRFQPYYYYWYYGTLALYQHGGPTWSAWNESLKATLVDEQVKSGEDVGSWRPTGMYAMRAGRIASTAMATLSLEVYYRYLPLYGFSDIPAGADVPRREAE